LEGTYRDNRREGKWRLFHEDGKLKQECHYAVGDLVRWEVWQAEGQSKKFGAWD
jgi:antitoxin component YwqK of YwqJK toxin-antitoxin module